MRMCAGTGGGEHAAISPLPQTNEQVKQAISVHRTSIFIAEYRKPVGIGTTWLEIFSFGMVTPESRARALTQWDYPAFRFQP